MLHLNHQHTFSTYKYVKILYTAKHLVGKLMVYNKKMKTLTVAASFNSECLI